MCQVQFSSHAIERVLGRLSAVISYGEVQSALSAKQFRKCDNRILVKILDHAIEIKDSDAISGRVRGDKVYALVTILDGNCRVDSIALSD